MRNRTSRHREARGSTIAFSGVNMAVRRAAIEEVGGLDPYFTFYLDDADVCLRLVRAGWRLAVAPGAPVRHRLLGGQHRTNIIYQVARSRAYFVTKNFGGRASLPIVLAIVLLWLVLVLGSVLYNGLRGRGKTRGEACVDTFLVGVKKLPGGVGKRIQRRARGARVNAIRICYVSQEHPLKWVVDKSAPIRDIWVERFDIAGVATPML